MSDATQDVVGSVVSLWRYPVKSMMGEELNTTQFVDKGVLGDRAYALVDSTNGKVISAKNPRKWPSLFTFHAAYSESPSVENPLPPVRISLPNGDTVSSEQSDVAAALSRMLGADVMLESAVPQNPSLEEYWPDMDQLDHRDTVTDEAMPTGTFFDLASTHLLTTATIDALRSAYPQGRFEVRRFRPNIVVAPAAGKQGFVENEWIDKTLAIGDEVQIAVTGPCPRCVMTTLPQGDLPQDPGILRTAVQQNQGGVGVYAKILQGGVVRRGDPIILLP